MNLDSRTMMVMMSALILLFSGLLTLAGLHAGNTRGVQHWALGGLCIGLGLGFPIPSRNYRAALGFWYSALPWRQQG